MATKKQNFIENKNGILVPIKDNEVAMYSKKKIKVIQKYVEVDEKGRIVKNPVEIEEKKTKKKNS